MVCDGPDLRASGTWTAQQVALVGRSRCRGVVVMDAMYEYGLDS